MRAKATRARASGGGQGKIKEWLTFDDMEDDDDTMMRGGLKGISFLAWNVLSIRQQQMTDGLILLSVSQGKKIVRQQGNFWEVEHNNKKVLLC